MAPIANAALISCDILSIRVRVLRSGSGLPALLRRAQRNRSLARWALDKPSQAPLTSG